MELAIQQKSTLPDYTDAIFIIIICIALVFSVISWNGPLITNGQKLNFLTRCDSIIIAFIPL